MRNRVSAVFSSALASFSARPYSWSWHDEPQQDQAISYLQISSQERGYSLPSRVFPGTQRGSYAQPGNQGWGRSPAHTSWPESGGGDCLQEIRGNVCREKEKAKPLDALDP